MQGTPGSPPCCYPAPCVVIQHPVVIQHRTCRREDSVAHAGVWGGALKSLCAHDAITSKVCCAVLGGGFWDCQIWYASGVHPNQAATGSSLMSVTVPWSGWV